MTLRNRWHAVGARLRSHRLSVVAAASVALLAAAGVVATLLLIGPGSGASAGTPAAGRPRLAGTASARPGAPGSSGFPPPSSRPVPGTDLVAVRAAGAVHAGSASGVAVTVTVTGPSGGRVAGDLLAFTQVGQPSGACGEISPKSGTTDASGEVRVTYTPSGTPGFCAVSATEQRSSPGTGQTGFAMIDEEPSSGQARYSVTVSPASASLAADGHSTLVLTVTVRTAGGEPAVGDAIWLSGYGSGCGPLSSYGGMSEAGGRLTVTYTAPAGPGAGSCTVIAQEADTAATGFSSIARTG